MSFIDMIRETSTCCSKSNSLNKVKIKIMDAAKHDLTECTYDYNKIDKDVIVALREEGFKVSLRADFHNLYFKIEW